MIGMKLLRMLWDLFFGAFLIGGAPWCIIAAFIVIGDLIQKILHVTIPDVVDIPLFCLALVGAATAFGFAIRHRVRRRVLPAGFLVLEILLGLAGAFFLFMFYGVVMYSTTQ
jgi:hypothetical protein